MADLSGRRLGPYELTRKLGQGGMGAVYEGIHQVLQVPRAVKVLLPSEVDEGVIDRFTREGQISASLRHPNIVQIFDVADQDDMHYLVMELIDGLSLLQLLRATGALPLERAVVLLRQVADALDYAHARGVVHRDIKPSNVIVAPDDKVTLIDFGIARALDESRLTRVGVVVGTFEYMAPEVVTEGGGSPGADRYALGIVAYQMLTGRVPFTGESAHSIMYRQVHDPPPPPTRFRPDLPGAAEDALLRQLAKSPDERFPSSQAFVDALGSALHTFPETQATAIADITRPGFDRPTPGSGQTPLPRSGRATRPATAATLTPPGARALPSIPPAPVAPRPETREATAVSAFAPQTAAAGPSTVAAPARRSSGPGLALVVGAVAVLLVLGAIGLLLSPAREAVLGPIMGATATTVAVSAPATTAPVTPAAQPVTQTPIVVTATPQAVSATPVITPTTPPTAVPPPTLTPNQRLAQVKDAADAGNFPSALALLDELRISSPTLADLDATEYDVHMAFAQTLLQQSNPDGAYGQFAAALKVRPNDPAAKAGQDGIVLAKNYAIMEANWDKDVDIAIKALEENMLVNPDYRETRQKLYALLLKKADRLTEAGERDAAFEVLMRALQVQPGAGEAQSRLVSYTPTPMPTATPVPYVPPVYQAPPAQSQPVQSQPVQSQPARTQPAAQPAQSQPAQSQPARAQPAPQPAAQPAPQPAAQPAPAAAPSTGGTSRSRPSKRICWSILTIAKPDRSCMRCC